ncbi:MAG TPA: YtxH domain-containing protein [Gemmatimonadaceae bacterium]
MTRNEIDDDATVIVERRSVGVGAFIVGMALGAGIALLLAPQSGPELRRELRRGARRVRRTARDVARDVRAKTGDAIDDARTELEARIEDARTAVTRRRRDLVRAVDAGKAAARDARETFQRRIAEARNARRTGDTEPTGLTDSLSD